MSTEQNSNDDSNNRPNNPSNNPSNNASNNPLARDRPGSNQQGNRIRVNFQMRGRPLNPLSQTASFPQRPSSGPSSSEEAFRVAQAALDHPAVRAAIARQRARSMQNTPGVRSNNGSNQPSSDNISDQNPHSNQPTSQGNDPNAIRPVPIALINRSMVNPSNTAPTNQNNADHNQPSRPFGPHEIHIQSIHHQSPMPRLQPGFNSSVSNVRLPPLEAEPVPLHQQHSDSTINSSQASKPMFDCGICFDILDDPTNCSNCKTKFCFVCISRVLKSSPTGESARCPTCRNYFTANDLTRDHEFKEFMEKQSKISCPHPGCNKSIPLTQFKKHEAECPHMLMKCKYHQFGCKWTGAKMQLNHHYENTCNYEKVCGLVDRFRGDVTSTKIFISQIQNQLVLANRHLQNLNNVIANFQSKDIGNAFHVIQMAYTLICTPVMFMLSKGKWKNMHNTDEARTTIYNFFYLFPFSILWARKCYNIFYSILALFAEPIETLGDEKFHIIYQTILYSTVLVVLGIFCNIVYLQEKATACSWTPHTIILSYTIFLFRDLVAICLTLIIYLAIIIEPSIVQRCVLALVIGTMHFFPALLSTVLAGSTADENVTPGRASLVIVFAIRYGIIAAFQGFIPLFDGVFVVRVLREISHIPKQATLEQYECLLTNVPLMILLLGLRMFFFMEKWPTAEEDLLEEEYVTSVMLTFLIILFLNLWMYLIDYVGRLVGDFILRRAHRQLDELREERSRGNLSQAQLGQQRFAIDGCIFFGIWCASLLIMAHSN